MARTRKVTRWRDLVAAALVTLAIFAAPWQLMRLAVDVMVMRPGFTRMPLGDGDYWEARRLEAKLNGLGYAVFYERNLYLNGIPAFGITERSGHIVRIDADLHWDARYMVLAHEAGHVLQPPWLERADGDVFAESVAVLVTHRSVPESARYLSDHKAAYLFTTIAEWQAMYHAAAVLLD